MILTYNISFMYYIILILSTCTVELLLQDHDSYFFLGHFFWGSSVWDFFAALVRFTVMRCPALSLSLGLKPLLAKNFLALSRICKSSHVKVSMHGISIPISGCVDFCLGPVTSTSITPPLLMKKKHSLDISRGKCPTVHNVSSLSTATANQSCSFPGSLTVVAFSPTRGVHIF